MKLNKKTLIIISLILIVVIAFSVKPKTMIGKITVGDKPIKSYSKWF